MQCRLHLLNLLGIVARDVGEESLAISLVVFAQLLNLSQEVVNRLCTASNCCSEAETLRALGPPPPQELLQMAFHHVILGGTS